MIALGNILVGALGFWVGWRGGVTWVLVGLLITTIVAAGDYTFLHPEGVYGSLPDWPWGATSFIVYVAGLAIGLIMSLMG